MVIMGRIKMLKTMKKYLCFMLSIIVVLSFTACNREKEEAAEGNNATISTGTANEETQPGESEEIIPEVSATPEPTEEPVAESRNFAEKTTGLRAGLSWTHYD